MSLPRPSAFLPVCLVSVLAVACAAPPPPTPAAASEPPRGDHYSMARLDKDGDGQLSLLEMREAAARKFGELDRDSSGTIEVGRECSARFAGLCQQADLNGDGKIERAEFIKEADEHFRRADGDRNGKLSRQELSGVTIFRW